jgi:hypothetical protein
MRFSEEQRYKINTALTQLIQTAPLEILFSSKLLIKPTDVDIAKHPWLGPTCRRADSCAKRLFSQLSHRPTRDECFIVAGPPRICHKIRFSTAPTRHS